MMEGYRAGQEILVRGNDGAERRCEILRVVAGGGCLVRDSGTGEALPIPGRDIVSAPERWPYTAPSGVGIVFFGNGDFALPVLRSLADNGYDIRAVVTNPPSRRRRGGPLEPTPVGVYAQKRGLTTLAPTSLSERGFAEALMGTGADVGVVVEFRILPESVYRSPRLGTINLHSSLLPHYPGASTVSSAILDGCSCTGLTTFLLTQEVDAGDVIGNIMFPIGDDNRGEVIRKMRSLGPPLVEESIQRLLAGCPLVPQRRLAVESEPIRYAPKVYREDMRIDWNRPAERILDFIRAYAPKPGAWTDMRACLGTTRAEYDIAGVKILNASVVETSQRMEPSTWAVIDGSLLFGTANPYAAVSATELQAPGKRRMTAREFCNGLRLLTGLCPQK